MRKAIFFDRLIILLCIFMSGLSSYAQEPEKINWISFSQLEDSLKVKPKKVFINFYAHWCTNCRAMDKTSFINEEVAGILNDNYYAVKMDVESTDSIFFGGKWFVNKRKKRVNAIHEIPLLMASRKDEPFSLPAYIILDEEFIAKARYFQYLDPETLANILKGKQ